MTKINGGYYMKARCIQNSEISIMPPYIREIWDWLLKEANHSDKKSNGSSIKRGQLIRTFKDIQEGLKWMIGYRKMTYKKWQCENSMRFLRKQGMVTTMKTTRGMLITICNYSLYQDPKNYESNTRAVTKTTVNKQLTDTINKNDKNVNNEKNVITNIYNYWNKQKIIVHRNIDKHKSAIRIALKDYSEEEIITTITNYKNILDDGNYILDKKWELSEFLRRKIDRFLDLKIAKDFYKNYKKGDRNGKFKGYNKQNTPGAGGEGKNKYSHLEEVY